MTNSTPTFWSVNGTSLQTYARNISTLGGDRLAPPPMRGANLLVPSAPGRTFMPKQVDQRVITLGMWIQGSNDDGTMPTNKNQKDKFMDNWRSLQNLLYTPEGQVTLTKRFYVDGVLKVANATAQVTAGMMPTMTGPARAVFTVDFTLADPFFYTAQKQQSLSGNQNITVEGDFTTRDIKFEISGSRKNIKVRNTTNGVQFEYRGDLSSGDKTNIDIKNYLSVTDPAAAIEFNSVGSILHTGDAFWMRLEPGVNAMQTTSDTGTGAVIMQWKEAWL